MSYEDLPVYQGDKTSCDNCNRSFGAGEVISVAKGKNLADMVFCYSDAMGGCVQGYVFSTGQWLSGQPMRFGKAIVPDEERTPNYQEGVSPVFEKGPSSVVKRSLLRRFLGSISWN